MSGAMTFRILAAFFFNPVFALPITRNVDLAFLFQHILKSLSLSRQHGLLGNRVPNKGFCFSYTYLLKDINGMLRFAVLTLIYI